MKILLGVGGGIAAYKAAELTRELQRRGADVQVVMTAGAERFVAPLTFAALSGHQVLTSIWQPALSEVTAGNAESFDIEHIRLAEEIDAVVIAPATANLLARLAHGMADDLLSTVCLASTRPIFLAPAMNVNMWWNPATQENLQTLRRRGFHIIPPSAGQLACGMVGDGRLAEPAEIADAVLANTRKPADLIGETILITAGGTREPIDPVRFLGNRSSGKMGLALAEASLARGAEVIFISAFVPAAASLPCEQMPIATAAEMQSAVLQNLAKASVVIMAAAVSDFRVRESSPQKLKKRDHLTLDLVQNPDILAEVVRRKEHGTLVIGFAAETENLLTEGARKLREKGVDAIVANDVSTQASGFESDRNAGMLLTPGETITLPESSKREMADRILDHLVAMRVGKPASLAEASVSS